VYKILSIFLIFGIIGCDGASSENTLKPPFINIDECIDYVNKLDTKKGYPRRKKESVINECQGSPNLMISG